jgi:hypothetical protein
MMQLLDATLKADPMAMDEALLSLDGRQGQGAPLASTGKPPRRSRPCSPRASRTLAMCVFTGDSAI